MTDSTDAPLDGKAAWEQAQKSAAAQPSSGDVIPGDLGDTYQLPRVPEKWRSEHAAVTQLPVAGIERKPSEPTRPRAISSGTGWQSQLGLNLIVFVASVCVMTLELTATRLVGKHIGNTIYSWTSVIGVVLAGITIGNALGGWLADRYHKARTLAWMFLLSSIASASVLWLDQIVPRMERPANWGLPAWTLLVVAMTFLAPALMLGTTSPLIASLALQRSRKTGQTLGNVYAWGAFGSIVGTFLTGFYLIDVLGTRAIIGLVAGTLAVLAFVVSVGNRVFRMALLMGWFQTLTLITAGSLATKENFAMASEWIANRSSWRLSDGDRADRVTAWQEWGGECGRKLHELGLLIRLRDDRLGEFHDESSYSYLNVGQESNNGELVKFLRLDKLIHSYYNPADPLRLHYDYERIYAAVTLQIAETTVETWEGTLPEFPGRDKIVSQLPDGVTFDSATQRIRIEGNRSIDRDGLRKLSPDFAYWSGVQQLHRDTSDPDWGGYTAIGIGPLPEGVTLPGDVSNRLRYDELMQSLTVYDRVTESDRTRYSGFCPTSPWFETIERWWGAQRKTKTLSLGGGGFIFPRWLAHEFPGSPAIDVVELDLAVYRTVQQELGLKDVGRNADPEHARIHTTIGDARNVVRELRKKSPVPKYDCIYGDAFNDFSIPWHLTTVEFHRELLDLLTPNGVYLANIIDAYPRTIFPGEKEGKSDVYLKGILPTALVAGELTKNVWTPADRRFAPLEVMQVAQSAFRLRVQSPLSETVRDRLVRLDAEDSQWTDLVDQLRRESNRLKPFQGTLPGKLRPKSFITGHWAAAPVPFEFVEVQMLESGSSAISFRGAISPDQREELFQLSPNDRKWRECVEESYQRSHQRRTGQFLARYAASLAEVFPNVYILSSSENLPFDDRDTLIAVASMRRLNFQGLEKSGYWNGKPFAGVETLGEERFFTGQMESLWELSGGKLLTDDHAPVDNLMIPIFAKQE